MMCAGRLMRRDVAGSDRWAIIGTICALVMAACASAGTATAQATSDSPRGETGRSAITEPASDASPEKSGSLSSTVVDASGAVIPGAAVTLTQPSAKQSGLNPAGTLTSTKTVTAGDGSFQFPGVASGSYELTIEAPGFATLKVSGMLHEGEALTLPPLQLAVEGIIQVAVAETQEQIAEEQVHEEERQRLLGVVPNFYVTYEQHPVPLTPRQKFQLAWKSSVDPVQWGINAGVAGFQQGIKEFSGYGQGMQGYAKRFAADTADVWIGTYIGGAILPSLLKQDPRYFYKGTGSRKSRFWYAMAMAVVCKGDNGRWQTNYSNILGSLAAGGISNLYYPASSRQGVKLTFVNAAAGLGGSAVSNVIQEFVLKRFTPHNPDTDPPKN